jgi:uncharacterized Zn finger protein (UPF0148 family)
MKKCKVCGKEFSNVYLHAKSKHGINKEDYDALEFKEDDTFEEEKVTEEKDTITYEERKEGIFGKDEDMLLSEFINRNEMTRRELENLIKRYKEGAAIPVTQTQKRLEKIAKNNADSLKDKDTAETNSVAIAEVLVKEHNFEVTAVTSGPPKMWHLKKRDS